MMPPQISAEHTTFRSIREFILNHTEDSDALSSVTFPPHKEFQLGLRLVRRIFLWQQANLFGRSNTFPHVDFP